MAFSLSQWARISSGVYDDSIVLFAYQTSDTLATVTTAGYFNNAPEVGGNDAILVATSDDFKLLKTSLSGSTLTASVADDGNTPAPESITTAMLADNAVTMAKSAFPVVVYNSKYTTVAGSATQIITGSFTAAESTVSANLLQEGATPRTIKTSKVNDGNITIVFDGDPSTDHIINVVVTKG